MEEWDDVSVQMTKEDKSVISVLTINNLSHQRYDSYDIVEIHTLLFLHLITSFLKMLSTFQVWHLQLQTRWAFTP